MKRFLLSAAFMLAIAACSSYSYNSFESMITKEVVKAAVSSLAKDHHNAQHYGPAWDAGVAARGAVYHEVIGDGWRDVLYASIAAAPDFDPNPETYSGYWMKKENGGGNKETYEKYQSIISLARQFLKDPERLKSFYLRHKDAAVEEIVKCPGGAEWALVQLDYVIPFFSGDIPEATRNVLEVRLRISKEVAAGETPYSELYAVDDGYFRGGISVKDINTYEWVERRRAERGQALVAAWAEILTDFRNDLAVADRLSRSAE